MARNEQDEPSHIARDDHDARCRAAAAAALPSHSTTRKDAIVFFDDLTLSVSKHFVLKSVSNLDNYDDHQLTSQLAFLIENKSNYWWLDSIADCFDKRHVDDGILIYKELKASSLSLQHGQSAQLCLHYWLGYFGGNPRGYVLMPASTSRTDNEERWKVLVENCDTDFIWRGDNGPVPKAFIKQVKMAAYGDKYRQDDE